MKVSKETMTDTGGKCLDGWMPWNGKCYFFLTEPRTYNNARAYCSRQGGKLAEPQSESDNEFLKKMARQFK
ncbi:C-type lectin domain-containing protein, partial [Staphylococcus aureus]|nr:C-type lectin domain-containing protein [Staphylococcus aureus]